jgi:N-acetylglucosamine-6-phosphate deacetylase
MISAKSDKLFVIQDAFDAFFFDAKRQKASKMEVEKKNNTRSVSGGVLGGGRILESTTLQGKIETEDKVLTFKLKNKDPDEVID